MTQFKKMIITLCIILFLIPICGETLTKKEKQDVMEYRNKKAIDISQEVITDFLQKNPHYILMGHTNLTMSTGFLLYEFILYNQQDNGIYILAIEPFGYVMKPAKVIEVNNDK